jgi:hypothetical protein
VDVLLLARALGLARRPRREVLLDGQGLVRGRALRRLPRLQAEVGQQRGARAEPPAQRVVERELERVDPRARERAGRLYRLVERALRGRGGVDLRDVRGQQRDQVIGREQLAAQLERSTGRVALKPGDHRLGPSDRLGLRGRAHAHTLSPCRYDSGSSLRRANSRGRP